MNMDLKQFKKIKEDQHAAVLQHPEGHHIVLAKNVLSPKIRSQLAELPIHAADGVDVPDQSQTETIDPSTLNAELPAFDADAARMKLLQDATVGSVAKQDILDRAGLQMSPDQINSILPQVNPKAEMRANAPIVPDQTPNQTPNVQAAPQAPSDPYGMDAYMKTYQQGLGEQKQGITGAATAKSDLAKAQEPLFRTAAKNQQDLAQDYQTHYSTLDTERQNFQQDLQNQHIDPQHYLSSMGTGQKISTGIGLILGGMGGGLLRQGNPALGFLNDQINRDIDSQKLELGKKENLLSANMRQFGNLRDATDMTRVMQGDIVKNQLAAAAAKSTDPLVQARAKEAMGQLDMQAAPVLSQMAMRKTMMNVMSGGGGGDNMDQQLNMLRMTNPEMAKSLESRLVPGVGVAQIPVSEKLRSDMMNRQALDKSLKDLSLFASNHAGSLDPAVINEGKAKASLVQDLYRRANDQGVFREAEKEFVGSIVGEDPTKFFKNFRTLPRYKAAIEDNLRQLNGMKSSVHLPIQEILKKGPPKI